MAKDYYSILGVSDSATADEIKSAFKKLARQYHPDVNKASDAESKFKELNTAYQTLSDPTKKSHYDMMRKYGSANPFSSNNSSSQKTSYKAEDFYSAEDIVNDIMKNFYGFKQKSSKSKVYENNKDLDTTSTLNLTFLEAALGCTKTVEITRSIKCCGCNGSGFKGQMGACRRCNGRRTIKQEQQVQGMAINFTVTCPGCKGAGIGPIEPCLDCSSSGKKKLKEKIDVKVPAGVEEGTKIKVAKKGNTEEDKEGNLYLHLHIQESHPLFKRQGKNIFSKHDISIKNLLLGGTIKAETIHGLVEIKIPEGCQPNTKLKISKMGIDGGDHFLELNVVFPKKITIQQKEIISKLDI